MRGVVGCAVSCDYRYNEFLNSHDAFFMSADFPPQSASSETESIVCSLYSSL